MSYTPLYTTIEQVAARLRGRLIVGQGSAFAPTQVDYGLLEQSCQQVEARVNAKLRTLYRLPLVGTHPVLASIVEKGIVCEVMATHYNPTTENPAGDFGRMMCSQFDKELKDVLDGAVQLEGETKLSGESAALNYKGFTQSGLRKPGTAEGVAW